MQNHRILGEVSWNPMYFYWGWEWWGSQRVANWGSSPSGKWMGPWCDWSHIFLWKSLVDWNWKFAPGHRWNRRSQMIIGWMRMCLDPHDSQSVNVTVPKKGMRTKMLRIEEATGPMQPAPAKKRSTCPSWARGFSFGHSLCWSWQDGMKGSTEGLPRLVIGGEEICWKSRVLGCHRCLGQPEFITFRWISLCSSFAMDHGLRLVRLGPELVDFFKDHHGMLIPNDKDILQKGDSTTK